MFSWLRRRRRRQNRRRKFFLRFPTLVTENCVSVKQGGRIFLVLMRKNWSGKKSILTCGIQHPVRITYIAGKLPSSKTDQQM